MVTGTCKTHTCEPRLRQERNGHSQLKARLVLPVARHMRFPRLTEIM